MTYTGEHAFIGQLGHFLVILAVVAALVAAISYWHAAKAEKLNDTVANLSWKKMGRWSWMIHAGSVLGIITCMFVMLYNSYYEYDYVWKHRNEEMPLRYIMSCFWEGQEGSFLLWSFWHVVLGTILMLKEKVWEARVMTVFSVVQMFLSMMLLGIYFGDVHIGSSPFILVRELPHNLGLPWTQMADYIAANPGMFADGKGLNPLLQNYWMTIHPPTLFLGFASTLVPFAFAISSLWKREHTNWVKPALPWTFFSIGILGLGVLMGGAWAYEALSFGGFWAWDPVENASLVPWLLLVAAGHVMLITSNKAGSWFTSALLCMLVFILIIYSTFLTRSGILGDASVHSFAGDGMLGQLLVGMLLILWVSFHFLMKDLRFRFIHGGLAILCATLAVSMDFAAAPGTFLVIYLVGTIGLLIADYLLHWQKMSTEESALSREFWIFLGSIVLILSAVQITVETSMPVIGKLFDTSWTITADITERSFEFHQFQIPFAIALTIFIGVAQYLKYHKGSSGVPLLMNLTIPAIASAAITGLLWFILGFEGQEIIYVVLLFSSLFAVTCNLHYWIRLLKGKVKLIGSPMAHIGFGLLLVGALISTSKSEKITSTSFDLTSLDESLSRNESVLMVMGDTVPVGPYFAVYQDKFLEGVNMNFQVEYLNSAPRDYEAGTFVYDNEGIFIAKENHTTGATFKEDRNKYWELLQEPTALQMARALPWHRAPGDHAFTLYPVVQTNERMGNVPEPDTRHWLTQDLYTHLQYAILDLADTTGKEWKAPEEVNVKLGDTINRRGMNIRLDTVIQLFDLAERDMDTTDFVVLTRFRTVDDPNNEILIEPLTIIDSAGNRREHLAENDSLGLKMEIVDFSFNTSSIAVNITEKPMPFTDFIVMQAIIFPYINILWIGCILMVLGTMISVWQRIKNGRKIKAA